jgi:hypothetical protein
MSRSQNVLISVIGTNGTLSSYAWICMILNFLQTRSPPILPSLHQRPHDPYLSLDGSESGFSDDLASLQGFGEANKSSIGDLLFQFFRYYAFEFNYDDMVVSVRQGDVLKREQKGWHIGKEGQTRLCIEEPFNQTRNLGNTADATTFRGIHLEIRSAFQHICNLDLKSMVEKFEWPPEQKEQHIFKRPQGTRPTLTAPPQNSSRKHYGNGRSRGNGGRGNHSGPSSRRSSTGLLGRNNVPPYLSSPLMPPEYISAENFSQWQQWQIMGSSHPDLLQWYTNDRNNSSNTGTASVAICSCSPCTFCSTVWKLGSASTR